MPAGHVATGREAAGCEAAVSLSRLRLPAPGGPSSLHGALVEGGARSDPIQSNQSLRRPDKHVVCYAGIRLD